MTVYTVYWTAVAEQDLRGIVQYIAEDSPDNARTVFDKLRAAATALDQFPERGRVVPELQQQGVFLYRELVIAPWRLIYRIEQENVYVLAVIDSRRNVEDILLQRLIE